MIHAVVPVQNEEMQILQTLEMLLSTTCDKIIVVLNGCQDQSLELVESFNNDRVETIYFNKALGIDVPRTIGAQLAINENTEGIIFVDGDMNGEIKENLNEIIFSLKKKQLDMALTNCYPKEAVISTNAEMQLSFRRLLNENINIFDKIGYSTPTHGPHGLSRKFLRCIPIRELAVPPVSLAMGVKHDLNIDIATTISVSVLPNATRDEIHADQIAKTIIGDCIEAINIFSERKRVRTFNGVNYIGYHKNRRFDILESFLNKN